MPPERITVYEQERLLVEAAEQVSAAMESAGVSKAELARRLGKTRGFITQVLSGERNMTLRTLADLASALDTRLTIVPASHSEALEARLERVREALAEAVAAIGQDDECRPSKT